MKTENGKTTIEIEEFKAMLNGSASEVGMEYQGDVEDLEGETRRAGTAWHTLKTKDGNEIITYWCDYIDYPSGREITESNALHPWHVELTDAYVVDDGEELDSRAIKDLIWEVSKIDIEDFWGK